MLGLEEQGWEDDRNSKHTGYNQLEAKIETDRKRDGEQHFHDMGRNNMDFYDMDPWLKLH